MKRIFLGLALASAFALSACSSNPEKKDEAVEQTNQANKQVLESYVWTLDRVLQPKPSQVQTQEDKNAQLPAAPAEMRPFDLLFANERISVQGLCNNVGGVYSLDGENITIGQMMSTRKLCSDEQLMEVEAFVGHVLSGVEQWQVEGVDLEQLAQSSPNLELRFVNGMQWQLQGTPTLETQYGQEAAIEFLQVDPQLQSCADGQGDCIQVRKLEHDEQGIHISTGAWELIHTDQLRGYELDPNYRNIIRVKRFIVQDDQGQNYPIYEHDLTVEIQPIN